MNTADSQLPPAPADTPVHSRLPVARWWKRALLSVLVLALLYALSAGPAVFLAQRRIVSTATVEAIYFNPYSPLSLAMLLVPGADWLMKRYIGFWESLTTMPPQ